MRIELEIEDVLIDAVGEARFNHVLQNEDTVKLGPLVAELNAEYIDSGKGLKIMKIAGGYQILSDTQYHIYLDRLFHNKRKIQLSRPAMEALSIIAYRQPVSKSEIESIRGVECSSVVSTLMERELVTIKGRGNTAGRPLLFGTTHLFLKSLGLEKISDLPKLKELSDLMGDEQEPKLFQDEHAFE